MSDVNSSSEIAVDTAAPVDVGGGSSVANMAPAEVSNTSSSEVAASTEPPALPADSVDSPSWPNAETYDWQGWDNTADSLPEQIQPWFQQFNTSHDQKMAAKDSELAGKLSEYEDLSSLYDSLMLGQEDPRIAKFAGERSKYEKAAEKVATQLAELEGKILESTTKYEGYEKAVADRDQKESERYAQWFQRHYPQVWKDEALGQKFTGLLEEGWNAEVAVELAELGEEGIKLATEAKSNGANEFFALDYAKAKSTVATKPQPRPGAQILSGATSSKKPHTATKSADKKSMNVQDLRLFAARKALRKSRRG